MTATDRRTDAEDRVTAYLARWPLLTETEARRELGLPVDEPTTTEDDR